MRCSKSNMSWYKKLLHTVNVMHNVNLSRVGIYSRVYESQALKYPSSHWICQCSCECSNGVTICIYKLVYAARTKKAHRDGDRRSRISSNHVHVNLLQSNVSSNQDMLGLSKECLTQESIQHATTC